MDNGRYIWCRNCGAIHHVSPFDRSPMYDFAAGEVQEVQNDDWRHFMDRHAGHRLEPLESTGDTVFPCGSAFDPMNVAYVQVSNGKRRLLLRRSRPSIEEPFTYEIVDGGLLQTEPQLDIQTNAIRKEMQLHFSWAPAEPLTDDQINFFLTQFGEVVQHIDPEVLRVSEYSDENDQTSYCEVPPLVIEQLMDKCRGYYPPIQLAALRQFTERHRDAGDVMAIIKRTNIIFRQST